MVYVDDMANGMAINGTGMGLWIICVYRRKSQAEEDHDANMADTKIQLPGNGFSTLHESYTFIVLQTDRIFSICSTA